MVMLAQRLLAVKQQESGPVPTTGSLFEIISDLGLTSGLKLCLDAGDAASYDPAVQTAKWLDTSGNGCDFFRGSVTGSDAADPTFNGTAGGLSSAEYWSNDGGDRFTYDQAIEDWMRNLSRAGAVYSFFVAYKYPSLGLFREIWGTTTGVTSVSGIRVYCDSGKFRVRVANGTNYADITTSPAGVTGQWVLGGMSYSDGVTDGCIAAVGDTTQTLTRTYTYPSTADEQNLVLHRFAVAESSIACIAFWDTAITAQNLTDIYNAIKGRFGL